MTNLDKKTGIENIYSFHHKEKRGQKYSILKESRGEFFRDKIGKGKKIIDLGCRDGALTQFFAEGNNVLGLDIDRDSLDIAQNDLGIDVKHADLNGEWDIETNTFDIVVAGEVLEHLYYPEIVVKKVAECLKVDGMFLGSVPNAFSLKNRIRLFLGKKKNTPLSDPTHINHFTRKELENILKDKFKEVVIYPAGKFSWLDKIFPGMFAFMFMFSAKYKK